ncbi:hypothetical protein [Phenylobacterium sp.]|uniref:hypothetical protein n=1 Tax=Phenylobacterium sp. TaxID=1871053 RepID=UPI00378339D3
MRTRALLPLLALLITAGSAAGQTRQELASACRTDPNYRAQDFILGAWDVHNGDRKTAEVTVEKMLGDCALRQTWSPAGPGPGSVAGVFSYSRYNGAWLYAFATDYNNSNYFIGRQVGPNRIEYTVPPRQQPDGSVRQQRWSLMLRPDGKVSELSLITTDGGRTWTQEYDLIWTKRR